MAKRRPPQKRKNVQNEKISPGKAIWNLNASWRITVATHRFVPSTMPFVIALRRERDIIQKDPDLSIPEKIKRTIALYERVQNELSSTNQTGLEKDFALGVKKEIVEKLLKEAAEINQKLQEN